MDRAPEPSTGTRPWLSRALAIGMLAVSCAALLLAPLLMPAGYSWLRNTTSESAAQGAQGAWLVRFRFLVFGSAAVLYSARMRRDWPSGAGLAHASLGALMIATSAF